MNLKYKFLEISKYIALTVYFLFPILVFAQTAPVNCQVAGGGAGANVCDVIQVARATIGYLNPILFAMCFVVFFWGLSKFILNSGSKDEIEKGKNYMFWAIIALFILISFRAIISFITSDFGFGPGTSTPQIPQA